MRAVADAGPLIHVSWIDRLDIFPKLFEELLVPEAVRDEVLRAGPDIPGMTALRVAFEAGWLTVQPVIDVATVENLRQMLGRGEAEAIVLMGEVNGDLILLDERRARRFAAQQGLAMTGTVGILRSARDRGLVSAVSPLLAELRRRGFRISPALLDQIRQEETAREE